MPVTIHEHLKTSREEFEKTGVFNAILDMDTRFFIDPLLLKKTKVKEFENSYNRVLEKFFNILKLLGYTKSENSNDIFWTQADKELDFSEVKGLCVGYSKSGTAGRGIGKKLRKEILRTAKQILEVGVNDPEIFELVGLFQKNIGADRISDMLGSIIFEDILEYTTRITTEFKIKPNYTKTYFGKKYNLIKNPFNTEPILMLPCEILSPLPEAFSLGEATDIYEKNEEIRNDLNLSIGKDWKKQIKNMKKNQLKEILISTPKALKEVINDYKEKDVTCYDFEKDPFGEIIWEKKSKEFAKQYPLKLTPLKDKTLDNVYDVTLQICHHFQDLIENNGLSYLLYDDNKHKPERAAQKLFYGIADVYCRMEDIDLTAESDGGRGPVDFKLSNSYKSRVLVETKLSSNNNLNHGFETQLEEYQKAEKTSRSIYLIIMVGEHETKIQKLLKLANDKREQKLKIPKIIIIDAIRKDSASKYNKNKKI